MYLNQMNHGIPEENHIHACSSDALIVMTQKHVQPLHKTIKRFDRLVYFWHVEISFLWLLTCSDMKTTHTF